MNAPGVFPSSSGRSFNALVLDPILSRAPDLTRVMLGLLVFVAPLALEGLPPWAALATEVLMTVVVLSWLASRLAAPVPAPLRYRALSWPLGALGALAALQLVPLPVAWVTSWSPSWAAVVEQSWPLLPGGSRPDAVTISILPAATFRELFRFALLVGLLFAVRDQMRSRQDRRALVHLLLLAGLVQVAVGVGHLVYEANTIYFIPGGRGENGAFFGTFIGMNRNAAYLNLLWPLALSIGLEAHLRREAEARGGSFERWSPLRRAGLELFPWPLYFLAALVLATGVVLCRSRMGWGLLAVTLVGLLFVILARAGRTWLAVGGGVAAMGAGAGIIVHFWSPLFELFSRLADKPDMLFRPDVWRRTWEMGLEHGRTGVGLGAYHHAFGPYNPVQSFVTVRHAENLYLEMLAELGVPGLVLLGFVLISSLVYLVRRRFWEAHPGRRAVPGMVVGLCGLAIHAGAEPALRGYGTAVTAALIAGLLLAALDERGRSYFDPAFRYGSPPWRVWLPVLALPLALYLAVSVALVHTAIGRAEALRPEGRLGEAGPLLERAARLAPWHWGPPLWQGTIELDAAQQVRASMRRAADGGMALMDRLIDHLSRAEGFLGQAARGAPMAGAPMRSLSRVSELSSDPGMALARAREAVRVQPADYRNHVQLSRALTAASRGEEGLAALARATRLAPEERVEPLVADLYRATGRDPVRAVAYMPETDSWRIHYAFGVLLDRDGHYAVAKPWLERVLGGEDPSPSAVGDVGWRARARGDLELAEKAALLLQSRYAEDPGGPALEAEVRIEQGRVDEAVKLLELVAPRRPPGIRERLRAAEVLWKAGRLDEAWERLSRLREMHPGAVEVPLFTARLHHRSGKLSLAAEALREAHRLQPELEEPLFALWDIHRQMGMTADAILDLQQCVALKQAPRCRVEAARVALEGGDVTGAVAWLEQAVRQDGAQVGGWVLLGEARLRQGDVAGARQAAGRARELAPEDRGLLTLQAKLASARGGREERGGVSK